MTSKQGRYAEPFAIERVEDSEGAVLFQDESEPVEVIRPEVAYVVTHMMRGVVEHGTARAVRVLNRPIAGKIGTTKDFRDNWFIGFTPQLVAGVWVGFDLPQSLGYAETGGKNAVPVFVDFFAKVYEGKPVAGFPPPPGVEFVRIDRETGLLASRMSQKSNFEVFIKGTAPIHFARSEKTRADDIFRAGEQRLVSGSSTSIR